MEECIYIDNSSLCGPDYVGYPLLASQHKDIQEFNNVISGNIANLTMVADQFAQAFKCTGPNIANSVSLLRFQISFFCSNEVNSAIAKGCKPGEHSAGVADPPRGPLLCKESCVAAVNSLQTLFSDQQSCPQNLAVSSRSSFVNKVRMYCDLAIQAKSLNNEQCTAGSKLEANFCGWRDQSLAAQYCPKFPNDPCCSKITPSTSNNINLILITVGSIFGLMICIAGYILFVRKRSRDSRAIEENHPTFGRTNSSKRISNMTSKSDNKLSVYDSTRPGSFIKPRGELVEVNVQKEVLVVEAPKEKSIEVKTTDVSETISPDENLVPDSLPTTNSEEAISVVSDDISGLESANTNSKLNSVVNFYHDNDSIDLDNLPEGSSRVKIIHSYTPELNDELALQSGTEIILLHSFDDGWGLGYIPETKQKGAFPLICSSQKNDTLVRSNRVSSMILPSDQPSNKNRGRKNHSSQSLRKLINSPKEALAGKKTRKINQYFQELETYDVTLDHDLPDDKGGPTVIQPFAISLQRVSKIDMITLPGPISLEEEFGK